MDRLWISRGSPQLPEECLRFVSKTGPSLNSCSGCFRRCRTRRFQAETSLLVKKGMLGKRSRWRFQLSTTPTILSSGSDGVGAPISPSAGTGAGKLLTPAASCADSSNWISASHSSGRKRASLKMATAVCQVLSGMIKTISSIRSGPFCRRPTPARRRVSQISWISSSWVVSCRRVS